jgi:hypothetical protein
MAKQRSQAGDSQLLEVDRKMGRVGGGKLRELTGKGQAFKTDQQKNKAKNEKQNKAKTNRLAHSDTRQTGQSQIGFQFLLIIWNFRHNNRLQFQISFSVGSIRRCSNAKGGIDCESNWRTSEEGAGKCSSLRW